MSFTRIKNLTEIKSLEINVVVTLALGSWPRQGFVKVQANNEAQDSHFMLPKVWESMREQIPTLPSELPF